MCVRLRPCTWNQIWTCRASIPSWLASWLRTENLCGEREAHGRQGQARHRVNGHRCVRLRFCVRLLVSAVLLSGRARGARVAW